MKKIISKTLTTATLAAAAAGAIALGAGTAAAETSGVPDGQYNLVVGSPIGGVGAPGIGQVPVTIEGGTLTIAGQSGRLIPTADGAKAVIAGQRIELFGEAGDYGVEIHGSTWGQLHRR